MYQKAAAKGEQIENIMSWTNEAGTDHGTTCGATGAAGSREKNWFHHLQSASDFYEHRGESDLLHCRFKQNCIRIESNRAWC